MRDIAAFETEFILSDLALMEQRVDRIKKQLQKSGGDENLKSELPGLEKCHQALETEKPLREIDFSKEEMVSLGTSF